MTLSHEEINKPEVCDPTKIAVLDIGSNSFHFVVAQVISGTVKILHKKKQKVRLADGLDDSLVLSDEAMERGINALARIKQTLAEYGPCRVKIVATYTIRKAINASDFIEKAAQVLPYPVEVISGEEEARLIFNGVANTNDLSKKTLVIDIGGGSTEVIIGEQLSPSLCHSLEIGCVSFTHKYFENGRATKSQFEHAIANAKTHIAHIQNDYSKLGWQTCIGTSGSVESVFSSAALKFGLQGKQDSISLNELYKLKDYCIDVDSIRALDLGETNKDRTQVFPAGLAILIALFESLQIKSMTFATAALREGVIYEIEQSDYAPTQILP